LLFGDQSTWNAFFCLIYQAGSVIIIGNVGFPRSVVTLVARPLDIATVHDGMDFIFPLFGILVPPTKHDTHGT
jgi:hypothetical protein